MRGGDALRTPLLDEPPERLELPLLYAGLDPAGPSGAPNALASALCGLEVRGDAILSSAELVRRGGGVGLSVRRPV